MADSSQKPAQDRRTFLKIGAGFVAGAAVASVVEIPYYSSVIGGNNSSSSSTVSDLSDSLASTQSQLSDTQSALSATQSQLSDTQSSLSAAQGTITNLNSQLSSSSAALSSANSQVTSLGSQLTSTQAALSSANAQATSLQGQVSTLQGQVSSASSQISSLNSNLSATQDLVDERNAFLSLSATEQVELAAICESIIPSDSTGPGAKEAGSVYFIDRQLRSTYGTSGNVYRSPPYIPANVTQAFTVDGIKYPGGSVTYINGSNTYTVNYTPTTNVRVTAGSRWQYPFDMKQFWTIGLAGIEVYSNAAYGANFEDLSAANQTACLTDLWNNKPTYDGSNGSISGGSSGGQQEIVQGINGFTNGSGGTQFGAVLPSDFAYELFFMVWNGFWLDPAYGGNQGMVGWSYVGFNGVNMGNFYGEGYTTKQLMVMNTPIVLQPASLGQFQKGSP